jgi:hypothetical protein
MMSSRLAAFYVCGLALVLSPLSASSQLQKTARDYYNELVKADGLEGFSNEYVCFRDDPNDDKFFTFSKTQDIAKTYPWEKFPADKRAAAKAVFDRPSLLMLGYKKGIQVGEGYLLDKDDALGNSFVSTADEKGIRIHFSINWKTMRYRWSIEIKQDGMWAVAPVENGDTFGKCEDRTVQP